MCVLTHLIRLYKMSTQLLDAIGTSSFPTKFTAGFALLTPNEITALAYNAILKMDPDVIESIRGEMQSEFWSNPMFWRLAVSETCDEEETLRALINACCGKTPKFITSSLTFAQFIKNSVVSDEIKEILL